MQKQIFIKANAGGCNVNNNSIMMSDSHLFEIKVLFVRFDCLAVLSVSSKMGALGK